MYLVWSRISLYHIVLLSPHISWFSNNILFAFRTMLWKNFVSNLKNDGVHLTCGAFFDTKEIKKPMNASVIFHSVNLLSEAIHLNF